MGEEITVNSSDVHGGRQPPLCRCALAFRIEDPQDLQDILGESVSTAAEADITRGLRDIIPRLLEHYRVLSGVTSPELGTWYVLFSHHDTSLPLDMDEQAGSLTAAATWYFRALLRENFGPATGTKTDFKAAVIHIPEDTGDDTLYHCIGTSLDARPPAGKPHAPVSEDVLRDIIDSGTVSIYLHPVVSLAREEIVGYEALARGPQSSPVFEAADMFVTADFYGLRERLELACIKGALRQLPNLKDPWWIAVNVSPDVLMSRAFSYLISQQRLTGMLQRVVLELTEHIPVPVTKQLREAVHELEEQGIVIALDDAGCGFARLGAVGDLGMGIVKLCITVTSRIGRHPDILRDVRNVVDRISEMGAVVLGEGVERKEQADLYRDAGVTLAQGFYFGRPRLASQVLMPRHTR